MWIHPAWVEGPWVRGFQLKPVSWQYGLGDRLRHVPRESVSREGSHQDFLEERDCRTLTHSLRKEGAQGGAREGRRARGRSGVRGR